MRQLPRVRASPRTRSRSMTRPPARRRCGSPPTRAALPCPHSRDRRCACWPTRHKRLPAASIGPGSPSRRARPVPQRWSPTHRRSRLGSPSKFVPCCRSITAKEQCPLRYRSTVPPQRDSQTRSRTGSRSGRAHRPGAPDRSALIPGRRLPRRRCRRRPAASSALGGRIASLRRRLPPCPRWP